MDTSSRVLLLSSCLLTGCLSTYREAYEKRLADLSDQDEDGFRPVDGDCNDFDPDIHPEVDEVCTPAGRPSIDEDCDGQIDEATAIDARTFYEDLDGDGFGAEGSQTIACAAPFERSVEGGGDCDDTAPSEQQYTFYEDADGDGFGNRAEVFIGCDPPQEWRWASRVGTDCDDADRLIHPDAREVCGDFIDNNCDGTALECAWPDEIQLNSGLIVSGNPDAVDRVGTDIAIGHLSGAETPDLIVGAPGARYAAREGALGMVALIPTPITQRLNIWDQAVVIEARANDELGAGVLSHDLNQDGYDDLVVTAPTHSTTLYASAGAVHVVYGPVTAGGLIDDVADYTVRGVDDNQLIGQRIASVGDINGDARSDLLVGSIHDDIVYLLTDGGARTKDIDIADEAVFIGTEKMGLSTQLAGIDYNGTGTDDIVITAPGLENRGAVLIYEHGVNEVRTQSNADRVLLGEIDSQLGHGLTNGGDQDGDGTDDIIVYAQNASGGRIYVLWSSELDTLSDVGDAPVIIDDIDGRRTGSELEMIGDINLDGEPDLAAAEGAAQPAGVVIFYGPLDEAMHINVSEASTVHLVGDPTSDAESSSILRVEDITDNRRDDLLIGSPFSTAETGTGTGVVYILDVNTF
ncbi:MAG: MopE-related protein [Myxococcota bacterium]